MQFSRSVLVPYPTESMFDLIEQAEAYPQFLPLCTAATIVERSDDWVAARMEFRYRELRFAVRTRNPKSRPEWLSVRLVEGPFKRFQGDWRLTRIGDCGCRVTFDVSYEIADGLLDRLARPAVDLIARSIMDAFARRADATLAIAAAPAAGPPDDHGRRLSHLPLPRTP